MPEKALSRPKEVRAYALARCKTAVRVLAGIMMQENAPLAQRVAAANSILDRGLGKAAQPVTGENGEGPVIARIERVIVNELLVTDKPLISNDVTDVEEGEEDV